MSFRTEFSAALADIAPAMIAAIPFGVIYGALASAKGMSLLEIELMSGLVFAGAAQFAALEIWSNPVPVLALIASTGLINARHVLMGASIAPKLNGLNRWQRLLGMYVLADENWAMAERRAIHHVITSTYFLGMAAVFYANWLAWISFGALLGSVLGDPRRFGADFAFTAIFIGLIVSFWTGPRSGAVIAASAMAAALVKITIGSPWHVLSGAFAGIAAAAALYQEEPAQ